MSTSISKSGIQAFAEGSVIISAGSASPKAMVLVLSGNVGVYRDYGMNTQYQTKVLIKGGFHGELSLFLSRDVTETLVALTDSAVMVITRNNYPEFFTSQPTLAFSIMESICKTMSDPDYHRKQQASSEEVRQQDSPLFPEGHKQDLLLPLDNESESLYLAKITCPLCGHAFDNLSVFLAKLGRAHTDPDGRPRYATVEPLYYETVTCPNCLLSANVEKFETVGRELANKVMQAVGPYKLEMYIRTGRERDTFTVFAGYFLALLCAEIIYEEKQQLITSNLWLKISRLYHDCGEEQMFVYATKKALEDYNYCYQRLNINEKQSQQVCFMLGEMHLRLKEYDKARHSFFLAKTNKDGTTVMQRQADRRIDDVKEIMQAAKKKK